MNLLYDRSLDTHDGVILHVIEELRSQELKEAAIAYFLLLAEGQQTEKELDQLSEKFLVNIQPDNAISPIVKI